MSKLSNNTQKDPQFIDPENGDFHIKPNPPCIDAGTSDALELSDTDFERNPRILGLPPDIGADEFIKPMLWLHLLLGD